LRFSGVAVSIAGVDTALECLALSLTNAAHILLIGKRSLSRLIRARKIEPRQDRPPTRVDMASLKAPVRRSKIVIFRSLSKASGHEADLTESTLLSQLRHRGRRFTVMHNAAASGRLL
jgi:hypothetical protein